MAVIFKSFEQIEIDGINAGSFSDVVANYANLRVELGLACKSFHAALVSDHKTALDAANATIAELQAKVAHLESIKSFDDSLISIDAFLARVQPEMIWLMAEAQIDETSNNILKMLLAKKGTKETPLALPVNLQSANLLGALGYLVSRGKLTPERLLEITLPASRAEAYDAD